MSGEEPLLDDAAIADEAGGWESAPSRQSPSTRQSHLISRVLTPAVRLWLKSQLDHVEDLQLAIDAGDRQLLTGAIQQVNVAAQAVVYRGIHLSRVGLVGEQIRTNLGQVLRGKPLRLLEAFPIAGSVTFSQADLNASLQSPLFADAVIQFLQLLLHSDLAPAESQDSPITLRDPQIQLGEEKVVLLAGLVSASGGITPIALRTGLSLQDSRTLRLDNPEWLPHANARKGMRLQELDGYCFDLGSQVALQTVRLEPEQIFCQGQIRVTP